MSWPIGTLVVRIAAWPDDDFEPPVGSGGEIIGALDADGDYEVMFAQRPCPVPPGEWYIPASHLMRVGDAAPSKQEDTALADVWGV